MAKTRIIIEGSDPNVLNVELSDVLGCIETGESYLWSLQWITAIGKVGGEGVLNFETEVNKSPNGILYKWKDLINLSYRFDQIVALLVCGDGDKVNLRRYNEKDESVLNCDYVLELVDSSYWLVTTNDERALSNMLQKLPRAAVY